jgi:hypothetical protein
MPTGVAAGTVSPQKVIGNKVTAPTRKLESEGTAPINALAAAFFKSSKVGILGLSAILHILEDK